MTIEQRVAGLQAAVKSMEKDLERGDHPEKLAVCSTFRHGFPCIVAHLGRVAPGERSWGVKRSGLDLQEITALYSEWDRRHKSRPVVPFSEAVTWFRAYVDGRIEWLREQVSKGGGA